MVPWAKLSQSPSSWINPDCAPAGFVWADPSKIRIDNLHYLLDHWRNREASGLKPLIWEASCLLLDNVESPLEHNQCSNEERSNASDVDNATNSRSSDDNCARPQHITSSSHLNSTSYDDFHEHGEANELIIESPPLARASSDPCSGMINLFSDLIQFIFSIPHRSSFRKPNPSFCFQCLNTHSIWI